MGRWRQWAEVAPAVDELMGPVSWLRGLVLRVLPHCPFAPATPESIRRPELSNPGGDSVNGRAIRKSGQVNRISCS
jgi:hypothetical protein